MLIGRMVLIQIDLDHCIDSGLQAFAFDLLQSVEYVVGVQVEVVSPDPYPTDRLALPKGQRPNLSSCQ